MSFDNISRVDLVRPDTAVVRTLRARESSLGPAKGMLVRVQEGVFLLDAKPRPLVSRHVHHLLAFAAEVRLARLATVPWKMLEFKVHRISKEIKVLKYSFYSKR